MTGQNVFITGSAGTGKSYLLNYIVQELKMKYEQESGSSGESVFVTAPTGIAAINVGGTTIHSFAGIGLGEKLIIELILPLYPDLSQMLSILALATSTTSFMQVKALKPV